ARRMRPGARLQAARSLQNDSLATTAILDRDGAVLESHVVHLGKPVRHSRVEHDETRRNLRLCGQPAICWRVEHGIHLNDFTSREIKRLNGEFHSSVRAATATWIGIPNLDPGILLTTKNVSQQCPAVGMKSRDVCKFP